jgi:hypothetical protein
MHAAKGRCVVRNCNNAVTLKEKLDEEENSRYKISFKVLIQIYFIFVLFPY